MEALLCSFIQILIYWLRHCLAEQIKMGIQLPNDESGNRQLKIQPFCSSEQLATECGSGTFTYTNTHTLYTVLYTQSIELYSRIKSGCTLIWMFWRRLYSEFLMSLIQRYTSNGRNLHTKPVEPKILAALKICTVSAVNSLSKPHQWTTKRASNGIPCTYSETERTNSE